jgi:hypothetical protein
VAQEEKSGGDHVTVAQMLIAFFGILLEMFVALLSFIFLAGRPFGIQIATLITYTGAVIYLVFCRTRYFDRGYSLREKAVQRQIPRLLSIHSAFLVLIFMIITFAYALRPYLPGYWFTEHGRNPSLFVGLLALICLLINMTQILISRRILSRSLGSTGTDTAHDAR